MRTARARTRNMLQLALLLFRSKVVILHTVWQGTERDMAAKLYQHNAIVRAVF